MAYVFKSYNHQPIIFEIEDIGSVIRCNRVSAICGNQGGFQTGWMLALKYLTAGYVNITDAMTFQTGNVMSQVKPSIPGR
ncbi:MAG: hypothetical protein B6D78_01970 [gamma proteobacterium symbiont of Ctena orbiculata]|nr:MAG: hypothetical protein B6D78_01970 [gamma proteobacterium symbiont of Ctena orbiculata]PVV24726.1 MAG: hypothetical protein B6D79_10495 [gamma proteobacterium symbiont of Ctena orbiculata]